MVTSSTRSPVAGSVLPLLTCLFCFLCLTSLPASAATLRVRADAPGPAHDGTTWATAFQKVQTALDAAGPDDEVWVAAGTYTERITVAEPLGLYGGFGGTETTREERNPAANPSIFDGSAAGTVVTITVDATGAILDGFTVRNGMSEEAGGIDCAASNAVLSHNVISGNWSRRFDGAYNGVGGLRVTGAGTKVLDNVISGNKSEAPAEPVRGGGVRVEAAGVEVGGNRITGNTAIGLSVKGGGLFIEGAQARVKGNVIADNEASADATFIAGWTTETRGAGAYVASNEARVEGNAFSANSGKARAELCPFACPGAGEVSGGGLFIVQDAADRPVDLLVVNNLMAGNRMDGNGIMQGGGLFIGSGPALVRNNTIVDNGPSTATEGSGVAASVATAFAEDQMLTLANNIIAFNGADGGGPGVRLDAPNVLLRHNDVFGNVPANFTDKPADPTGTNGNIATDPLFQDRAAGNYRLADGSPALDAGDSAGVPAEERDLDGNPLILGTAVDIGAWEAALTTTFADAALALKAAGGLSPLSPAEFAHLNAVTGSPETVDELDAIRLARTAVGMD